MGAPAARVITLEGSGSIAGRARANFGTLGLGNISVITGNFDNCLQTVLDQSGPIDLAFVDGNHRLEPTLRYFEQLLPRLHNDSILVFDDIHWSGEMERAWDAVKAHPKVTLSIDLFFLGIVFFREEFREKQDFSIRF